MHVNAGVNELRKALALEGLTPDNSFTLEAIFRTQTQVAYSAGRWNADQDPAVQEILWGYKYVTVGDDRVRPEHVGLDGATFPKDDAFWNTHFPPCGWGCRCQAIPIYEEAEVVRPPAEIEVDGKMVRPGADPGFRFNPGKVFQDQLQLAEI
jgi:SPP1 gp7 family putative phage head morphogenesis protein